MILILEHRMPMDVQHEHAKVQAAKLTTILAGSDSPVVKVPSKCDLRTIEKIQTAKSTHRILPAD